MGEGRAYTHESLDTKQRHAVAVPARFRLPSTEHPGVKRTVRISAFTRCGGTYPAWGPLPGLPMVPTSAARRPIALRREPTVALSLSALPDSRVGWRSISPISKLVDVGS